METVRRSASWSWCVRALLLLLCCPFALSAFAETDEELAARFYPQGLDQFFIQTHAPDTEVTRTTTLLRVDLVGSGADNELIVVYSNGLAAELFLFRGSGAEAVLLDQANDSPGGTGQPTLEVVDIENDGILEIEVGFRRETWLYKFDGTSLAPLGPPGDPQDGTSASLGTVAYFDIDGDGRLEILEHDGAASDAVYIVHKLGENGFARTSTEVAFFDRFEQEEGLATSERDFIAAPGNYSLQVVTFAPPPEDGVGEVTLPPQVTLNGALVNGANAPSALSGESGIPVTLLEENALSVELPGAPERYTYIVITRTR